MSAEDSTDYDDLSIYIKYPDESPDEPTRSQANQDDRARPQVDASQEASSWLTGLPTPDDSPTILGEHLHVPTSTIAPVASGSTINNTGTPQSQPIYHPEFGGWTDPGYDYPTAQPDDFPTLPAPENSSSYLLPPYHHPPSHRQQVPTDDFHSQLPTDDLWWSDYAQSVTPPDHFNLPQLSMSGFLPGGARSGVYPSPPSDSQSEYLPQPTSSEARATQYMATSPHIQDPEMSQREHRSRVQQGDRRGHASHSRAGPSTCTSSRPVEDPSAADPVASHNPRFQPYARAPSRRMGRPAHTEESQVGPSQASRRRKRAFPQNHSSMSKPNDMVNYGPMMQASSKRISPPNCSPSPPPRPRRSDADPSTSVHVSIPSPTTYLHTPSTHAPLPVLYSDQPQASSSKLSPPRLRSRPRAQAVQQSPRAELEASTQHLASSSKRKRVDEDEADKAEGNPQVVQPRRNVRPQKRARADSEDEDDYHPSSEVKPKKQLTTKRPPAKRGKPKSKAQPEDNEDKPSFPCTCGKTFGRPQDRTRHYLHVAEHREDRIREKIEPPPPQVCKFCNTPLGTRRDAFLRHMREAHSNVDEEDDATGGEEDSDEEE